MEYLKLLGILIIIIGFVLKWDTTAVVVIAAIVTGLFSGMNLLDLLSTIGKSFVDNRMVSLFFLTLPMIGLVESHGLRHYAVDAIKKMKKLTAGRILNIYLLIRELAGVFGISLQGQVQFIRPIIAPMVTAAAEDQIDKKLTTEETDLLKGRSASIENFGNFFAQNLFVASSGVLLISSTMRSLKYDVDPVQIVVNTIPIAIITFVLVFLYNLYLDHQMKKWEEA
ncbi:DUF969 domain-containing protein [Lactobacillus kalixensis]|uniref:Permease n=1 Tax=Lactobacillus kalixensis DSM 16043 TaxID=1423763 RepID=A0A0R1UEV6_9LACO|nr:DUF969 domain-containing protein [Lactobacillus kalixensis]KRL89074.1 permease [Lactobacillus kalixensis DSM 16043]